MNVHFSLQRLETSSVMEEMRALAWEIDLIVFFSLNPNTALLYQTFHVDITGSLSKHSGYSCSCSDSIVNFWPHQIFL